MEAAAANTPASPLMNPATCRPSGSPSSCSTGSETAGIPRRDTCTVQLGSPVEFETHRRGSRGGQADAGVAIGGELGIERARHLALGEVVAIILEAHGLGLGQPGEADLAELARVPLAVGVERPAAFPCVDAHGERTGAGDDIFERGEFRMGLPRHHVDSGGLDARERIGHGLLGARRCRGPAGGFEEGQPPRRLWRRRARRAEQAGIAGIAAGADRDLVGDVPGIVQARRQNTGRALAQAVIAAAAIERADRRLEADASAIARRTDGRPDHLRAEACAQHSRRNRGGRAAARSAGGATQVMRVARAARLGGGKFGGDGLSNDHRAGFAQRRHAGGIALGAKAREQRRAVLGRHVGGLDDVLDADWHAVDR